MLFEVSFLFSALENQFTKLVIQLDFSFKLYLCNSGAVKLSFPKNAVYRASLFLEDLLQDSHSYLICRQVLIYCSIC